MNKAIAFILGIVFGMILLLGAVGGIIYYVGWELTPQQVEDVTNGGFDSGFLGTFKDLSIADMVAKIGDLFDEKAGKLLSTEPDENGHYYSIDDFLTDNNMNLDKLLGFELPQSVKDIPLFEFFAKADASGETGLDRALKQIKLSAVPDIVNLFAGENKIVSDAVLIKLSDDSLFDLFDENVGIKGILEDITFAELLPDVFPTDDDTTTLAKLSSTEGTNEGEGETQTVDQMRTLMIALGKTRIGAAIYAFTNGGNILLELKSGCSDNCTIDHEHTNDGVFAELGKIEFTALIGNDPTISSILGGKTLADILNDEGDITLDPVLNDLYVGSLIGLKQDENGNWVNEDGSPADAIYTSLAGLTVKQLMDDKLDALNDMTVGELIGYVRNQVDPSNYTTDTIVVDGVTYVKQSANGAYARALLTCGKKAHVCTTECAANCDKTHAHSDQCYTWYEAELTCTDTSSEHAHTADCYGYVWYGECTNDEHTDDTAHKAAGCVKIDGKYRQKADGLYGVFAGISVGQLMNGGIDNLLDDVKNIKLGDLLGADNLQGIAANFADMAINDIMNGDAFDEMYLGDLLGNVRNPVDDNGYSNTEVDNVKQNGTSYVRFDDEVWYEAEFTCSNESTEHTHTAACYGFVWYGKCTDESCTHAAHVTIDGERHARVDALYGAIGSITIGELTGGSNNKLMDSLMDLTIKDIVGEGNVDGPMANIAHMTIRELISDDGLNNIYLGTFLGNVRKEISEADYNAIGTLTDVKKNGGNYIRLDGSNWYEAKFNCTDTSSEHSHTAACYGYVWYVECSDNCTHTDDEHLVFDDKNHVKAEALYNTLGSLTIGELTSGSTDKLMSTVKSLTLKELAGDDINGVMEALSDKTIDELMNGAIDDLYVGQLLQRERKEINVATYIELGTPIDGVKRNGTAFAKRDGDKWYEATFNCDTTHEHTATCYEFVWYTDKTLTTAETGVTAKLANQKVGKLDDIDGLINDLTLSEVLGDGVPDILQSIKDTKIGNLSTAIDNMYLGEFLKYHRNEIATSGYDTDVIENVIKSNGTSYIRCDGDKWYEATFNCDKTHEHTADCYGFVWYTDAACTTKATGVTAKLANQKVGGLDNLDEVIDDLTLVEVMGEDKVPEMLQSIKDTKIGDLNDAINGLYLGEFLSYSRNELATDGYTEVVENVKSKGTSYVRCDGGVWYEAEFTCTDTACNHDKADCYGFVWYVKCADNCGHADSEHTTLTGKDGYYTVATGVTGKLADIKVDKLDTINDRIETLTLKDVMGDKVPSMLKDIEDTKIGELETAINDMYLGSFFGNIRIPNNNAATYTAVTTTDGTNVSLNGTQYYMLDSNDNTWYYANLTCTENHEHNKACFEFAWFTDGTQVEYDGKTYDPVSGLTAKLCVIKVSELDSIETRIKGFTLSEVLGDDIPAVLKTIGDTKLSDLNGAIEAMRLGDMLGYARNTVDSNGYNELFTNIKTNGTSYIMLDDGIWYEAACSCADDSHTTHNAECYDFVWYQVCDTAGCAAHAEHTEIDNKNYVKADGLMANLASLTINELKDNDSLKNNINKMKLGDVITIDDNSPMILRNLQNSTIGNLGNEMNGLTLADVIEINGNSPYLLRNLQNTKLDELGTQMNDLTLADVIDTKAEGTSPIIKELADQNVNDLGTAINDLYAGTAMGYYRNELDKSSYTNDIIDNTVMSDGTGYIRNDGGKWYEAKLDCTETHTHTADCYGYVWYEDENHTKAISGVTAAFVNSKISKMADATNDLTLTKLGIVDENSSNLLKAVKDTKLNDLGTAINNVKMGVMFGYEEANGTWYVKCADDCGHGTGEHTTLEGKDGNYTVAKGLYAKLSSCTVNDISDNHTLTTIVKDMTIGDFIDSGMLTIADENQANLDVMIGCEHKFKETINVKVGGISANQQIEMEYTCNLSGYIQWKLETSNTDKSAEMFFKKATHTDCAGKWRNMTLDQFLNQIFNVLNAN